MLDSKLSRVYQWSLADFLLKLKLSHEFCVDVGPVLDSKITVFGYNNFNLKLHDYFADHEQKHR